MRSAFYIFPVCTACLALSACALPPPAAQRTDAPAIPATTPLPQAEPAVDIAEPERSIPLVEEATPPTVTQADTWQRLRQGMTLDYTDKYSKVRKRAEWYMRKNRKDGFLHRALQRGQYYLPYILAEVERRNLPTELALLPLVESAYHPYAHSNKRAMGLWQFIPSTGRIYGLQRDWWHEGRRDVHAATHAALDYLEHLYEEMDGDWLLALASYNTGEKNVHRAVTRNRKRGKPTDFWALRLPRETRYYVPNLLAVTELVRHPARYGLDLQNYPGKVIEMVSLDGPIDLALAAELAGIDINVLYTLNPGSRRWMTHPGGPHRLLLPANSVERFRKRLAAVPESERVRWVKHQLRRNDTLYRVAAHYGLDDTRALAALNDIDRQIPADRETLRVPTMMYPEKRYRSSMYKSAFESMTPVIGSGHRLVYRVREGDSLWLIARRYGVSIQQLKRWNPKVASRRFLQPGNRLVVWRKGKPATAKNTSPSKTQSQQRETDYVVRSGDSLWRIAKRFDTTIARLAALNQLDPDQHLMPGRRLRLPSPQDTATTEQQQPKVVRYVVKRGDSLWLIAKRFDTSIRKLASWNALNRKHPLRPGQQLKIYIPEADGA